MLVAVFWIGAPCSLVGGYRPFRGTYRLLKGTGVKFIRNVNNHLQDCTTSQPRRHHQHLLHHPETSVSM